MDIKGVLLVIFFVCNLSCKGNKKKRDLDSTSQVDILNEKKSTSIEMKNVSGVNGSDEVLRDSKELSGEQNIEITDESSLPPILPKPANVDNLRKNKQADDPSCITSKGDKLVENKKDDDLPFVESENENNLERKKRSVRNPTKSQKAETLIKNEILKYPSADTLKVESDPGKISKLKLKKLSNINKKNFFKREVFNGDFWSDFREVFFSHKNNNNDKSSLYVLGDADGSFARLVLSAMIAGYIIVKESAFVDLEFILKREAETNFFPDSLEAFQGNQEIYDACSRVLQAIKYKNKVKSKLVFLGDIVCDRLTCNLTATLKLVENLHKQDAIFIKGNHDAEELIDDPQFGAAQSGEYRVNSILEFKKRLKEIVEKCFKFAHYESEYNILFTHVVLEKKENQLCYCAGDVTNEFPAEICASINNLHGLNRYLVLIMTNTRKKYIEEIDGKVYTPMSFIQLYGHDEDFALEKCVYALSEIQNGRYSLNPRYGKKIHPKFIKIIRH